MELVQKNQNETLKNIIKGLVLSLIITFILLFIFAVLMTYTNINESVVDTVIIVITAISILIGSSIGNYKIKKNGLINGGIIGSSYILTIYIISSLLNWQFGLSFQSIVMIVIWMFFGILGGIIGVNKK